MPIPVHPTTIDIRAQFALAKVYRAGAIPGGSQLRYEALDAAHERGFDAQEAANAHGLMNGNLDIQCPIMFMDEPELCAAWDAGVQACLEYDFERAMRSA